MKRMENLAGSPAVIAIIATVAALAAGRSDTPVPPVLDEPAVLTAVIAPARAGDVVDLGGLVVTASRNR